VAGAVFTENGIQDLQGLSLQATSRVFHWHQ